MPTTIRLKDNLGAFRKHFREVEARFPRSIDKAVDTAARKSVKFLKQKTPKQSGALSKSFNKFKTGKLGERIIETRESPKKYVEGVEGGTGIFGPKKKPITPKKFPFLQFKVLKTKPSKLLNRKAGKLPKGLKAGQIIRVKSVKGFKGFFMFKKMNKRAVRLLTIEILRTVKKLTKEATRFRGRLK